MHLCTPTSSKQSNPTTYYYSEAKLLLETTFTLDVPMLALTATATPKVRGDVMRSLHIQGASVHQQTFNRNNLHLRVVDKPKKVCWRTTIG